MAARYLLPLVGLTAAIWTITRLPFVPYNLRELLYAGHPIRSAFLLAIAMFLTLAVPVYCAGGLLRRRRTVLLLPVVLCVNATLAYLAVVNAVPSRSLHDIVGFPVLNWPADVETWLRFVTLHAGVTLMATGGAVLALVMVLRRRRADLFWLWMIVALGCAPLLHWVIVSQAATDNLTELMRDGGSPLTSVLLAVGLWFAFAAASAVAASWAWRCRQRVSLAFALLSVFVVYGLVVAGTEPALVKYGKVFSALQFMLSPDRASYVGTGELILRYAVAYALLVGAVVALQYSPWRTIAHWSAQPVVRQTRVPFGVDASLSKS